MGFSQPSTTQTVQQQLSPAQQSYQNTAANWLTGQVGQTAAPYTGQLTAPLSPEQAQNIGQQGALAQSSAGPEQAGLNTLGNYAAGNYLFDPTLGAMLGSEAQQAINTFKQALPYATAPFQMAGQTGFSTPAQNALGQSAATFSTQLAQQLAQQAQQDYLAQQGFQTQAAAQAVPIAQGVQQQGLQALTMPQATQQQALTSNYNEWLRQMQQPWSAALAIPNLVGSPIGQTSTATQSGGGSIFDVLGGLGSMAGPFAMLKYAGII